MYVQKFQRSGIDFWEMCLAQLSDQGFGGQSYLGFFFFVVVVVVVVVLMLLLFVFFFVVFFVCFFCLFVCLFVFRKWPAFKHNLKLMVRLDICFMYFPPRECFTQVTVIFQDFLYFTFIVPFYHIPSVPWKKRLCISTSKVMPLAVW